ncbi:MAG: carbohydrate ABC transporter permease [Hyphomicrobiales bacterium]|nr:carbohydrate ABC transporter permease [Hyphomicrobiales bacterium]
MMSPLALLRQRRNPGRIGFSDVLAYIYLAVGVFLMFGPVVWLVLSSFKTRSNLDEFPPTFLPLAQQSVAVKGYDSKLPLYNVTMPDGSKRVLAQVRRIGVISQLVDPAAPQTIIKVNMDKRTALRHLGLDWHNYEHPLRHFNFGRYLWNSVFVTVVATLVTLLINSMAAYALSIHEFRGKNFFLVAVIATLMVPITIILVPVFVVVNEIGLDNSLWAVILPGAATPTGVFLLRQYMLTMPRELIEAARMDKASEWQIYARIVMPLALPALAVLTIFSVMWRWNEFLWPLVVLSKSETYTLQIGLNAFQGDLQTQWNYLLAMTVVALIPIALVFVFLQRFITSGIANTGMK